MSGARDPNPRAFVADWWQRAAVDAPLAERRRLLDDAVSVVWRTASETLGDITLGALMERVIFDGADRFRALRSLSLDSDDARLQPLADDVGPQDPEELEEGLLFVLAELLAVIGRITADILTPALRAALLSLPIDGSASAEEPADELEPAPDGKQGGTSK